MAATDRILIQDLLLRGVIGLNEWERAVRQDILVNVTLFTDLRRAGATDDPGDMVDYKAVTKAIIAFVEGAEHYLVEALATGIARICVVDFLSERVVVRVEKPGALRFARSVGVEVERTRGDFDA